jgi:hypothetical protein
MRSDVKSFVQSFARGMAQRRVGKTQGRTDPDRRTDEVRELGVEAVAKALNRHGVPRRSLTRFAS